VLLSSLFYDMDYYCLVVHLQSALIVSFLETLITLVFPIVSCVLIVNGLWFGFLLFFLIFFRFIIAWSTLIILVIMVLTLGLGLRVHETIIQKIGELIKDIFLSQLTILGTRRAWLLVEPKHGEGVETEKH
jgi:hypothetical protein